MDLGPNSPFWAVFFWASVVICLILAIVGLRVMHKYETRRKQLKVNMEMPGMENVKWLFKHRLKEHDIFEEKQINEKTNTDLN